MKKIVFAFISLLIICTACEGPMGPPGEPGRPGEETQWDIKFLTAGTSTHPWVSLGKGRYQCFFNDNSLTDFIYNEGAVLAYYMHEFDTPDELQIGLPHVFFGDYDFGPKYTATYTYEMTPGSIAFNVAYSDFINSPPPMCTFRVVKIW